MAQNTEVKRGRGRPKGSVNKVTATLKDAILEAAERAGNKLRIKRIEYLKEHKLPIDDVPVGMVAYLELMAVNEPGTFMPLLGKILPMQVTGKDDGPIEHKHEHELKEADEFIANELTRLAERVRAKEDPEHADSTTTH